MYRSLFFIVLFYAACVFGTSNSLSVHLHKIKHDAAVLQCTVDSVFEIKNGCILSDEGTYVYPQNNTALPYYTRIVYTTSKHLAVSDVTVVKAESVSVALDNTLGRKKGNDFHFDQDVEVLIKEDHCFKTKEGLYAHVLKFFPYSYHPSSQKLDFVLSFTVKIESKGGYFHLPELATKFDVQKSDLKRLVTAKTVKSIYVVYDDAFFSEVAPYIEWKTLKGHAVYCSSYNSFSSSDELMDSIRYLYDNNDLGYLVLIGDHEHIPALENMGSSDASYGFLKNDDFYPEIAVGRFSATTKQELRNQIVKSIAYEKSNFGNWQDKFALIASEEGPGDNMELDYEHMNRIKDFLEDNGRKAAAQLYDGILSHGELDAAGNPTGSMVNAAINDSIGLLLYMGHGGVGYFKTADYKSESTIGLTNTSSHPFSIVGGCQVGNFVGNTCLAEAFMRAEMDGTPTGLSLIWASTGDQDWSPPMYAQDVFVSELVKNNALKFFGDLAITSSFEMNVKYGINGFETTSTWVIFGDPALQLFTKPAQLTTAVIPHEISTDDNYLDIYVDAEGLFSVVQDGKIVTAVYVTSGLSRVLLPSFQKISDLVVCFSANNRQPFIDTVRVNKSDLGYMVAQQINVNESSNNGYFDAGDTCSFSIVLKNEGLTTSKNVVLSIECDDEFIHFIDNESVSLGEFAVDQTGLIDNVFRFVIDRQIENKREIVFVIIVTEEGSARAYEKKISVVAPLLYVHSFECLPTRGSDADSFPEPGEIVAVQILVGNRNFSESFETGCSFTSLDSLPTVLRGYSSLGAVASGFFDTISFLIKMPDTIYVGVPYAFLFESDFFDTIVHINPYGYVEDWENNYDGMYHLGEEKNHLWHLDSEFAFEGENSLKSALIAHDSISTFSMSLNCVGSDSISFYVKTSCEDETNFGNVVDWYDYLLFTVDGVPVAQWAGETDWLRYSHAVTPGLHTFAWQYIKDEDISSGSDAAWLDYISFPSFISAKDSVIVRSGFSVPDTSLLFVLDSANSVVIPNSVGADSVYVWSHSEINWLHSRVDNGYVVFEGFPLYDSLLYVYATYYKNQQLQNRQIQFFFRNRIEPSDITNVINASYFSCSQELKLVSYPAYIQVVNSIGRVVYEQKINDNASISLQNIPDGWHAIVIMYPDRLEHLYIVKTL